MRRSMHIHLSKQGASRSSESKAHGRIHGFVEVERAKQQARTSPLPLLSNDSGALSEQVLIVEIIAGNVTRQWLAQK
jgi:hypothetical protein